MKLTDLWKYKWDLLGISAGFLLMTASLSFLVYKVQGNKTASVEKPRIETVAILDSVTKAPPGPLYVAKVYVDGRTWDYQPKYVSMLVRDTKGGLHLWGLTCTGTQAAFCSAEESKDLRDGQLDGYLVEHQRMVNMGLWIDSTSVALKVVP